MNDEKSNCCETDNSGCSTQETNCCSPEQKPTNASGKKKIGLGVLFIAISFAVVSAFTMDSSSESASCSTEASCATSCETGSAGTSCCSKK